MHSNVILQFSLAKGNDILTTIKAVLVIPTLRNNVKHFHDSGEHLTK